MSRNSPTLPPRARGGMIVPLPAGDYREANGSAGASPSTCRSTHPLQSFFVEHVCASEDLRRALRILTARERQVVVMVFRDGMSERAIAQTLGVALSTVCVYKERALRKLRRAMGLER